MQTNPLFIKCTEVDWALNDGSNFQFTVARLDEIHPFVSGNKFFKLKYNLQKAVSEGRKGIITMGGAFSMDKMWQVHGMAHVWAARAVVPEMVARGEGYFVVTASAAGLLTIVESAPYAVTKHAAVAFAEWLRVAYGRRGVRVSCLCPQGVHTAMTAGGGRSAAADGMLTPAQVAADVVAAMRDETFLVLPHPEVLEYFRRKGQDYDRWLGGMQKIYARQVLGQ